jgi:TolB protein
MTVIAGLMGVAMAWACRAERVDLEAYASGFDSIPIAVLSFRPTPQSAALRENQPWKIVADDLAFTGRFFVTRATKPDSAAFAENNIGIFIDGEYTVRGNSVELDCYLHDATTMDLLVGKKFRGEKKFLRSMAHRYANQVYEMLLGEQGPFESKIVFVRDGGAVKNLFLMDFDGYNIKQITSYKTANIFPAFVDSTALVWTSFIRGKPDIYRGSIATGKSNIFVYSRFVETSPEISHIEGKMAYSSSRGGNLDIYTCDLEGGNRKQLTFNRAIDTSPTWSPNGYHIAFTSDRAGGPQIYVMDAEGANTRRLTFEGRYQDSPAWSPKGDRIAYASLHNGKFDIWTIEADGSNPTAVTSCPGNNEYPTWAPDASMLCFVSTRGGRSDLYAVRPDGSGLRRLTRLGNAKMPDWSGF